jgi:hypothetical protein
MISYKKRRWVDLNRAWCKIEAQILFLSPLGLAEAARCGSCGCALQVMADADFAHGGDKRLNWIWLALAAHGMGRISVSLEMKADRPDHRRVAGKLAYTRAPSESRA